MSASPQAIFQSSRNYVLPLEVRDDKGERLAGQTAVAIDVQHLVSSCESLYGDHQFVVVMPDGAVVPVARGTADPQRNLCLLDTPVHLTLGLHVREQLPAAGERIYAVSNALGLGTGITEGVVSGIRTQAGETYIQFTAPIAPGSEGGALLDESGQLLGIIDYHHRDGQNVNFAAPAIWIGEIASRALGQRIQRAKLEIANELASERDWSALARHAEDWSKAYPDDPQAHFWLGLAAAVQGNLASAESAYRDAQRLEPTLLRAGLGLADALLRQGKAAASDEVAQRLLVVRREDPNVWNLIGRIAIAQSKINDAEHAFRKVLSLNPWSLPAYEGLAAIAAQRGDTAAQVEAWAAAVNINPESSVLNLRLASAWLAAGNPKQALRVVERVLSIAPSDGDAWYWKAEVLLRMERPIQAEAALRRSLAAYEKAPAWAWSALSDALWTQQRYEKAIAAQREAVKIEPGSAKWRGQLGVKLKDAGYLDEASEIFQRLASESPEDPFPFRQIGFVRADQIRHGESIEALERSLALDPKQGKVWTTLVEQYHAAKRKDDAIRAYRRLREIDSQWAETAYRHVIVTYEVAR